MRYLISAIALSAIISSSTWQIAKWNFDRKVLICETENKNKEINNNNEIIKDLNVKIETKKRQTQFIQNDNSDYADQWLLLFTKKREQYQGSK